MAPLVQPKMYTTIQYVAKLKNYKSTILDRILRPERKHFESSF